MALRLGDLTGSRGRYNPFGKREDDPYRKGRTAERKADRRFLNSGSTYGQMRGIGGGIAGQGFGMLGTGFSTAKRLLGDLEKDLDPAAARQRAVNEAAVNAEIAAKSARGTLERSLTGTGGTRLGSGRAVGAMKDLEMRSAAMKAGEMNRAARAVGKESQADLRAGLDAASRMSGQGVSAIGTGLGGLDSSAGGQMRLGGQYDERSSEEAETAALQDPNLLRPPPLASGEAAAPQQQTAPWQQTAPAPVQGTLGAPAVQQQPPKNLINGRPASATLGQPSQSGTINSTMSVAPEQAPAAAAPASRFDPAQGIPQDPAQQDALLTEIGYNPAQLNPAQRDELLRMWQTGKLPGTGLNRTKASPPPMTNHPGDRRAANALF